MVRGGLAEGITIGLPEQAALRLEPSLCRGSTESCELFRNEPLADQASFMVKELEMWTFRRVVEQAMVGTMGTTINFHKPNRRGRARMSYARANVGTRDQVRRLHQSLLPR